MVDYGAAIKRPFSDFKKLGIGALLYLIPFVNIITGLFASGYSLVCARAARERTLPEWKNWGDLFVKGLLATIISIIYFIPTLILVAIFVGTAAISAVAGAGLGAISMGGGAIIAILVGILTIYVLPSAIVNFAIKENFGAAFSGEIFRKAFSGKYLATWLVVIIYSIIVILVAGLISMALAVTVVIPLIVSAFASIIISITTLTAFGEAYSEMK